MLLIEFDCEPNGHAALFDSETPFKATVHLNYEDTVLKVRDGLPKLKDFPAAIGGSGETMPE